MLIGIGLIAVVWSVLVLALQRRVIYPRGMIRPAPNATPAVAGLERLWMDTPPGRVEAWLLPADPIRGDGPAGVVMYAHGNGELIDDWPEALEPYRRLGLNVLLVEFRGYGRSAGSPSEAAIISDLARWYDRIAARPDVDADRIVFHGRSLGAGAMGVLTESRPPAAMILESAFTSVSALAWRAGAPPFLLLDRYDNVRALSQVEAPVLILHGRDDTIVPVTHAHRLKQVSSNGRLVLYDGGHNDGFYLRGDYWRDIESFLREHGIVR